MDITEKQLVEEITSILSEVRDPEKSQTLGELAVINSNSVTIANYPGSSPWDHKVQKQSNSHKGISKDSDTGTNNSNNKTNNSSHNDSHVQPIVVTVHLQPTVPYCHLTQQIGLSVHLALQQQLPYFTWQNTQHHYKLLVKCFPGTHDQQEDVEKQMNDKERIAAALENPDIYSFIHNLI